METDTNSIIIVQIENIVRSMTIAFRLFIESFRTMFLRYKNWFNHLSFLIDFVLKL